MKEVHSMSKESKKEIQCINDLIERMKKESSEGPGGHIESLEAGLFYLDMYLGAIINQESIGFLFGFFYALYAAGYITKEECKVIRDEARKTRISLMPTF